MDDLGSRLAESLSDLLKDRSSKQEILERKLENLEQIYRDVSNENNKLNLDHKILRETLDKHIVGNKQLREEIDRLTEENKILREDFDKTTSGCKSLRDDLDKLSHENKSLREELDRLNTSNRTVCDDLTRLTHENKTLRYDLVITTDSLRDKLVNENKTLREDFEKLNEEGKNLRDKFSNQLDAQEKKITNCEKWNSLLTAMANEIKILKEDKEDIKDWKDGVVGNLRDIDGHIKQLQWQQQQLIQQQQQLLMQQQIPPPQQSYLSSYRTPVRSPSASSFLNGIHRRSTKTSGYESLDPRDDISELSEGIENLKREVDVINELQSRFDNGSSYLDNY